MGPFVLQPARDRISVRRAVSVRCEAVSLERFRLLGTETLDLSSSGMLVAADDVATPDEAVLVHLFVGDEDIVAAAEVARVVSGMRRSDRGVALGLRFTRVSSRRLHRLLHRLRGTPPPVPRRSVRLDYARSVQSISRGR